MQTAPTLQALQPFPYQMDIAAQRIQLVGVRKRHRHLLGRAFEVIELVCESASLGFDHTGLPWLAVAGVRFQSGHSGQVT